MRSTWLAGCVLTVCAWAVAVAQTPPAALDAQPGPHGFGAWAPNNPALFGQPSQIVMWTDKERYDTLDASGGAFIYVDASVAKPENMVILTIRQGDKVLRRSELPADKGCVSVDLNVAGLAVGEYAVVCELASQGKALHTRSRPMRMEAPSAKPASEARLGFVLRNPAGDAGFTEPAYACVVVPKGQLTDPSAARLVREDGSAVPAQFKAWTRWDKRGSVKWLGVWFLCGHAQGARETRFAVVCGPGAVDAKASRGSLAAESKTGWDVVNGPLRVVVSKLSGRALEKVYFDADADGAFGDAELAYDATQGGPYLVTDSGDVYQALADAKPSVVVEENGPEVFALRVESWYVGKQQAEGAPGLCKQITRLRAQRGVARLDIAYTWLMTARSPEARFNDIGLKGRVPGATRVVFGMEEGPVDGRIADQPLYYLLQDQADHCSVWMRYSQAAHYLPRFKTQPGWSRIASGSRAPGWAAMINSKAAVAVGCEDFWQNYPKEISADGDALTFHAWPAHGVDRERDLTDNDLNKLFFVHEAKTLNFAMPSNVVNYPHGAWHTSKYFLAFSAESDAIGVAKTHYLRLCFFPAATPLRDMDHAMRAATRPQMAAPDAEVVMSTGALGQAGPRKMDRFADVEKQIEEMFKGEIRLQDLDRDYGMFIFGGGHSGYDTGMRAFDVYRAWRITHHNAPRTPWLLFFRSGDPFYADWALRSARHVLDIGVCHYSRPDVEKLEYGPGKRRGALNDYKGLVPWHSGNRNPDYNSMIEFMNHYTYMTGDTWGRDVAREWQDCSLRWTAPGGSSRTTSGSVASFIELYEDTWDRRLLPFIEGWYLAQLTGQDRQWGYLNEWQNYAPWLDRYWLFTGSRGAKDALVKWADAFLRGWGDQSEQWGSGLNIPALAWQATGDAKYLRYTASLLWDEARSSYDDPDSAMHGLYRGGAVSLGHYYMQRAVNAMEALRSGGDQGMSESRWLLNSAADAKTQEPFVDALVKSEDGKPFRVLLMGVWRDEKYELLAFEPGGAEVFRQEIKAAKLNVHGSDRPAPHGYFDIPARGKPGVYRLRVRALGKLAFNLQAPLTESHREVYPLTEPGVAGVRAGRMCFALPAGSGRYTVTLASQKGGPYPSSLYDDNMRLLAKGAIGVRPHGASFPVTVDSAACQRYMFLANRANAVGITIQGKAPPRYVAVSFDRLFDPEEKDKP